jgi:hypothetical protein
MNGVEFHGEVPWEITVILTVLAALLSWFTKAWFFWTGRASSNTGAKLETDAQLEIHRDELTFQLLQNARLEMASARIEVEDLREEVRKLRSMENHFYYFQQSLDHLEALLFPGSPEERLTAERNARAFLQRMRRLNEAKGTIANETQRAASAVHLLGDDPVINEPPEEKKDK